MARRFFGLFLLCLGGAAACSSTYEEPAQPPPRADAAPPPVSAKPATPKEPNNAVVRQLYRDDWFGGVTLLGIDAAKMRAVVRLETQDPPKIAIDTIDLQSGQRVDRWEATGEHAQRAMRGPSFTSFSGSFDADLTRFAKMLSDLGPWHLRHPLSSPTFAVSPQKQRVLFGSHPTDGSEGDWLFAAVKDGKPRRIDQGLVASYSPVFSPDGENVAFIGCAGSPCDYGLFLSRFGDERPRRVAGMQRVTAPMWSASGDSVLALGARAADRCLFRVSPDGGVPRSVACVRGLADVNFAQDPEGRTAAVAGVRGQPGKQVVDVTWVLLENGNVLGTTSVDRAVGSSVLSASGLMAMPMQRGALGAVDLVTGSSTIIPESEGWFFGFEGARWVGDTLIVLRKVTDRKGYDIVAIDIRKASGRRPDPWL